MNKEEMLEFVEKHRDAAEAYAETLAPIIAEESRIRNERWAAEIRERQMDKGEE